MPTSNTNKEQRTAAWIPDTAANVSHAIGSFFSGGDNQSFVRNRPPSLFPAKSTPTGKPAAAVQKAASPGGGGGWGMLTAPTWGTSVKSGQRQGVTMQTGSRSTNNAKPRVSPVTGAAPANNQAAVDRSVNAPRSAEATAADPLNWAGIARVLGNAGSPGFAKYKSGGYASSNAQAYVKKANIMPAPPVAKAKSGSRGAVMPY